MQDMRIRRLAREAVRERLGRSPAVCILGPRQAGKTTLARSFPGAYFDLEQEADRIRLDLEWDDLVAGRKLVILDEAQEWPDVFPRLRGAIDADRRRAGRFLLLGSVSPALMTRVSDSLAGRMALVELSGLLGPELGTLRAPRGWFHGGFPDGGVLGGRAYPAWQRDYIELLTRRDLPAWGLPAKPALTDRLLRMLAAVHGQPWNASRIAASLGISYPTVNTYLDFLEGAYLIRRLKPYAANLGKRLVRTPKIYWRDSGLLHAVLNVPTEQALLCQPWVGASWEGYVIGQILDVCALMHSPPAPYFFRSSDGYEIDLVLDFGDRTWAIEVKLASGPSAGDLERLAKTADMIGAEERFIISRTKTTMAGRGRVSCSLPWFLKRIARERK